MGYFASKVKLSYEFSKAIPTDNARYRDYLQFKEMFGDDGNLLVVGIQTPAFFQLAHFKAYREMQASIKKVNGVEDVISVPGAVSLVKDSLEEKLTAQKIFPEPINNQAELDEAKSTFLNLPFYRSLLYNPQTSAYLLGVRINKEILNSPKFKFSP